MSTQNWQKLEYLGVSNQQKRSFPQVHKVLFKIVFKTKLKLKYLIPVFLIEP